MTIQKKKHNINDMKEKRLNFDQTAFHIKSPYIKLHHGQFLVLAKLWFVKIKMSHK